MRDTQGLSDDEHHQVEADLFYEFQARAGDLSKMRLTDWECLFFARHHSLPTRLLDWTDTFGTALYFSVEYWQETVALDRRPAVWVMNPYQLNEQTWDQREIISPKYLGIEKDGEYWDFGELLDDTGEWGGDGRVAIYPVQINDRVRAQSGWFTIHGNDRRPLEVQYPGLLAKIVIEPACNNELKKMFEFTGMNKFSLYTDLDSLAEWLREDHLAWKNRELRKRR